MLHQTPPTWAHLLPGYGGFRILTNPVLTPGFPQTDPLLIALARLAAVTAAAACCSATTCRSPASQHYTLITPWGYIVAV
jgi:hypothetical protein